MKSTSTDSKKIAGILLDIGAVLFSRKRPFKFDSGILSPVYVDNRTLISYPKYRKTVAKSLTESIKENFKGTEVVAGTATAGIPHAAWVSQEMGLPMVYVRSKPKDHGRGNQVEGAIRKGQKVVIIEDLISTGGSAIAVADALTKLGAKVLGISAIYTHGLKEAEVNFAKAKIKLTTLTNTTEVANLSKERGFLKDENIELIESWIKDPKNWTNAPKQKSNGPTYNLTKSWDYNYEHGPNLKINGKTPPLPKEKKWSFLGKKLISPLGIAAGPLPNSKWIIPYARLGYGSLILKTVRSSAHKCHPYPNMLSLKIKDKSEIESGKKLVGSIDFPDNIETLSITNSFGNPCRDPKVWSREIKKSKKVMAPGQLFGVSVYGTSQEGTTIKELAKDYAKTALLAKKAGATFIEANLACPNVKGAENPNLYKDADSVLKIVLEMKKAIGKTPLILKIGYFEKYQDLKNVIAKIKGKFEAISAINTIPRKIVNEKGEQALPGRDESGVCGYAIKDYGIETVKDLTKAKKELKTKFEIIGVGGVMTPGDVKDYLDAGANHVHSATAIMWNPYLAHDLLDFWKNPTK